MCFHQRSRSLTTTLMANVMFILEQKTSPTNLGTPKQLGICKFMYHEMIETENKLMAIMRNSNNIHLAPLRRLATSGAR